MQFDADEDGEPFFKPPAVSPTPVRHPDEQPGTKEHLPEQSSEESANVEAAATATIEQEE